MGLSFRIDEHRRLILARGWGVLTDADVEAFVRQLLADPAFHPSYGSLTDLREVERAEIDAATVFAAAAIPMFDPTTRRAVVASSDAVFGVARMFASLAERAGQTTRVFRTLPEAERWLHLDHQPPA